MRLRRLPGRSLVGADPESAPLTGTNGHPMIDTKHALGQVIRTDLRQSVEEVADQSDDADGWSWADGRRGSQPDAVRGLLASPVSTDGQCELGPRTQSSGGR